MLHSAFQQFQRRIWYRTRACYSTSSEQPLPTIGEVRDRLFEQMSGLFFDRKSERPEGPPPLPQEELPQRTIQESWVAAIVPLGSDDTIRDEYRSFLGTVRVGRLMEDMDLFAVWTTRAYLQYPQGHIPLVVTIFIDEFEFTPILPQADQDIRLRGRVTWTGKTSLEAEVRMEQFKGDDWKVITKGFFLMGARTLRNKSMDVNRLRPTSPAEEKTIAAGYDRKRRRASLAGDYSLLQTPTSSEYAMLHHNYLATVVDEQQSPATLLGTARRPGCVRLIDSRLTATVFAHPIHRNMYNTVFGGYIMLLAQELSSSNTYLLCHEIPVLRYISYITFRRPIEIGSLIIFHSLVTYTVDNFAQVQVSVEVMDAKTGASVTSIVLHLTYQTARPQPVIFPDSYSECLVYLEGRRQFITAAKAMGRSAPPTGSTPSKKPKRTSMPVLGHQPSVRPVPEPEGEGSSQ